MDITYVLLLVLVGMGFFLGIEWLMLASIFLFIALVFSRYYSEYSVGEAPPIEQYPPEGMAQQPPQNQPPIVVVTGGSSNAATITDQMISTMMGNLMAMDVYEKEDTPPIWAPLQRGRRMRQGFFDHHGKYGSKHKSMAKDHSNELMKRLDSIDKKLGGG